MLSPAKRFLVVTSATNEWQRPPMPDLKARRQKADALAADGKTDEAVNEYAALAAAYAGAGLLLRAIAVCKRIFELDPEHDETQELLASLYARRTMSQEEGSTEAAPVQAAAATAGDV